MIVAVALFELHIPYAQSLKEKRMVVRSVRDKLRARYDMSVAEVGMQDLLQRARIGLSFVALDDAAADSSLDRIRSFVEENTDATVSGWTSEKIAFDEDATL